MFPLNPFDIIGQARKTENLVLFTRYLAGAMNARVPLHVILGAYGLESEGGRLAKAVGKMAGRVEQGVDLSLAMEEHPELFSASYRRLVRLGEEGRTLGGVMNQLADGLEESLRIHEYFRRAAIYPLILLVLLAGLVSFMLTKGLGTYREALAVFGIDAMMLFGFRISPDMVMMGFAVLLLIAVAFLFLMSMRLRLRVIGTSGRFSLMLPLLGPVLRRGETARFAGHLSLLLENRIPMVEALELLAESSDNPYVRSTMEEFTEKYRRGERLSDLLASQPLFPPTMSAMVASAESHGDLALTLRQLGHFYAERTSHELEILRELYEPVMLILAGLLIGLVLFTMYLPLFELPQRIA